MKNLWLASLVFLVCTAPVLAAEKQSHAQIREVALAYAQAQTQTLPGKVRIKVEDIDPRTVLPACSAPEAFLPGGSQLMGKTSIGVRCNEKPGWSVFVQASIRVSADMLVANRPLAQNTVLSANDFSLHNGELGQPGILIDPAQAIGKTLKFSIGAGQVLRQDMLRAPYVVMQGQTVSVRVSSNSFSVRSSGQALNSGARDRECRYEWLQDRLSVASQRRMAAWKCAHETTIMSCSLTGTLKFSKHVPM